MRVITLKVTPFQPSTSTLQVPHRTLHKLRSVSGQYYMLSGL